MEQQQQQQQQPFKEMALSFAAGSLTLANWGFSAGDVAILVGAGRKAGTWVFAQMKDQNLLDWMGVDLDAVLTRKGLCDTAELHARWDKKITLVKNGQRTTISSPGGTKIPVVEDMGRFTWLMTLLTAGLDAAMQKSTLQEVVSNFLEKLFKDNKAGEEVLKIEVAQHIQGWLSAACVRSIGLRAKNDWNALGKQGQHQPGFIPHAEFAGVLHFLHWLVAGHDNIYSTPSTDIYCLAVMLERLGLKIKTTLKKDDSFDESDVVVVWSNALAPTAFVKAHPKFRPGMRIPLSHMEEVASLFPRNEDRNKLRELFLLGMEAVEADGLSLHPAAFEDNLPRVKGSPFLESDQDLYYAVRYNSRKTLPRLVSDTNRFAGWLFPTVSPEACTRLSQVIEELCKSTEEDHNVHTLALSLSNQEQNSRSYGLQKDYDYGDALCYLQAFFLGYWYQLLLPLLDTSQLETQEGFGSWSWADLECLDFIRETVHTRVHQRTTNGKMYFMYRFEILKLTAYLFGGAEISQLRRATYGSVGVMGKIPVLYSSLVRGRPETFGKFSLLDIDASFIPSSDSGIVIPGSASVARFVTPEKVPNRDMIFQCRLRQDISIKELTEQTPGDDEFTVHIEPDWNFDSQTCLVVYRHKGRVITRLDPRQIDLAIARHFFDDTKEIEIASNADDDNSPPFHLSDQCEIMQISGFHIGQPVEPEDQLSEIAEYSSAYVFKPIIINLSGMINAFICIACLYEGWEVKRRIAVVSTQDQFEAASATFAKVVIVMPNAGNF